jgi:Leucine-rich repeat (LRR) protein
MCKLTVLSPKVGKLANLREQNLSRNRLTAVPDVLGHMKNLKKLDVGGNRIRSLPLEIEKLTKSRRGPLVHTSDMWIKELLREEKKFFS